MLEYAYYNKEIIDLVKTSNISFLHLHDKLSVKNKKNKIKKIIESVLCLPK